jgi:diacylglycerol O-acyltransferase
MSSNGQMHIGLIGCRDALPDIADLGKRFQEELDDLYDATVGRATAGPATSP